MTTADYDILIVGGGLSGASLAARLRHTRWRTGLLDPRSPAQWPGPRVPTTLADITPRVSALAPDSQAWLEQCGAWQQVPPERLGPYHGMQVWDAEGSGRVVFDADEVGLPALGTLTENAWLERALWEEILDHPHVEALTGQRAQAVQAAGSGPVHVILDSGQTVSSRLLVLADGARSPTREQLGFRIRRWDCHQRAIVTTVEHELPHGALARQSFHRNGPLAFLPLHNPHWSSIVWSLDTAAADAFLALPEAEQQRTLSLGLGQVLGRTTAMTPARSFPLHQMHAHDYWQPGVVLLGDTAHQLHPLAGQGANLGLRDARALYHILAQAEAQGVALEEPLLLRRYTRERQPHNLAAIIAMEGFRRLFAPENPVLHSARNLGLQAFNRVAGLRRAAMQAAAGR